MYSSGDVVVNAGLAGQLAAGATAHCAATDTFWVEVNSVEEVGTASIITVDLNRSLVTSITSNTPQLAGHFANCKTETLGGIRLEKPLKPGGVSTIEIGEVSPTGKFRVVDSIQLPAGSVLEPTGSE